MSFRKLLEKNSSLATHSYVFPTSPHASQDIMNFLNK